jgi:hypothetical protein
MKRMTEGLEVYKHMLRAFTAGSADELLEGIDSRVLLKRIEEADADATIRQSDLTQALDRVDRLQAKIEIRPQVLTYNRDRRRLFLADRSFLFYRKYGTPTWPWEKDDTLLAALGARPARPQRPRALGSRSRGTGGAVRGESRGQHRGHGAAASVIARRLRALPRRAAAAPASGREPLSKLTDAARFTAGVTASAPKNAKGPMGSGLRQYRHGDSNPGFRRERAAS